MKARKPFRWRMLKDGTIVLLVGNDKVLEIIERPHTGFCCMVFRRGEVVSRNGYHGRSLPSRLDAVMWGVKKGRELELLK